MIQACLSRQFLRFLLTGGVAAVANFLSRLLYSGWVSYSSAIVMAHVTGMIVAFVLARLFVFQKSRQVLHRSVLFFVLVNAAALLQTWGIAMGLSYYWLPTIGADSFVPEIAHGIGIVVPVFSSYFGHKYWSFREGSGCRY